jgi:hypothetical protein
MSNLMPSPPVAGSLAMRLGGSWPEVIYWAVAVVMVVGFVGTLVLLALDTRSIDGHASVWVKPLKFELSLAIHAGTLALAVGLLSPPHRQGVAMLAVALVFLAACTIEMGYIFLQAARAEHSHFNVGTPFHRAMYSGMAICAVIIVGAAGAIGLSVMADANVAAPFALRTAIVLGFVGGTILTLITAFAIGARTSPYVGGIPDFSARMALTGWSRTGGDLRVSHFLATHMIQILPLTALAFDRIAAARTAQALVVVVAIGWAAWTIQEFRIALAGSASILSNAMP